MQKSTSRKRLRVQRGSAKERPTLNKSPGRQSTLEFQTSRTQRAHAKRPAHSRHERRRRRAHTREPEYRTWFLHVRSEALGRARLNYREESCRLLVSSSCRWRLSLMRAYKLECRRSSQPKAKRSCRFPTRGVPAE